MPQPIVMISHQMLDWMQDMAEAAGWRVIRGWDLDEADKAAVRAIIHPGSIVLSPDFLLSLPRLGLIANVSAGYDGVDVDWCRGKGIEVTHAKALNAEDVADLAMGLLLASWRNIALGDQVLRSGGWWQDPRLKQPRSLRGRKLGVVGLGSIGASVAVRAQAFGIDVSWWGPREKAAAWPRAQSLIALAKACDILVVASRADDTNTGLISAEIISALGPQGLLVNVARGLLVDEEALIAALREGRLGAAALDVYAEEPTPPSRWANVPNTLLTPHIGGGTSDSFARMTGQAIDNIARFLAGEPLLSPV